MPTGVNQVCIRCRQQKRKCDKLLPTCSLCKRLNRACSYPSHEKDSARLFYIPNIQDLTPSNIRLTLEGLVSTTIGDASHLQDAAATYFRTIHTWLPVLSENAYRTRLSHVRVHQAPSDFSLLTLSMFLLCGTPVDGAIPMETKSLYTQLKTMITMLEATGTTTNSIETLQSRLLLTVFEVGHAMYPAAYISAGANVRAAVALGADASDSEGFGRVFRERGKVEEARRTWRAIVIVDRYASLESGKASSSFRRWSSDSDIGIGQSQIDPFTKVTQASRLLEQVLAHIHESTSDYDFNFAEALQLLKTMISFLAAFQDGSEPPTHTVTAILSNSAVAVCRSAMLEILHSGLHVTQPGSAYCTSTSRKMLTPLIDEIVHDATLVLSNSPATATAIENLPVFIPHYIYRAAVLLLGDLRGSRAESSVEALTRLLRCIGGRWMAGRLYAEDIEKMVR